MKSFHTHTRLNQALTPIRLEVAAVIQSPLPVSLDLIKSHCAVDGSDLDTLLETYLFAAIEWAEGFMKRSIYSRSHTWILERFPYTPFQEIRLPRGKTQSVESVAYVLAEETNTLTGPSSSPTGTDYQEDLTGDDGGTVMPLAGDTWPDTDLDHPAPVTITFTAGWLSGSVPSDVTHALLFSVSDALELRGSADLSTAGRNFHTREALLSPYKLDRFY